MILEALDAYARTIDTAFEHDRTKTLGASEVGLCIRRAYYAKRNFDEDPRSRWGAQVRGEIIEEHFWYPALKMKFGKNLLYAGPDQRTLVKRGLSATPDGLVVNQPRDALRHLGVRDIGPDRCFLIECKSIDPRVPLGEAKAENVFQVQQQLGLMRELTEHRPRYALVSYTNASFWDDVTEFVVKFNPSVFKKAKLRAAMVFSAKSAQELRPEGWIAGGKECEYCKWATACGVARRGVPKSEAAEVDPQFQAEIEDLCRELNRYRAAQDESSAKVRDMQDQIKDRLRAKGVKKIKGVVSWSEVVGRTSYDTKAMQADGIDLEKYSKVGDPSDRLVVERDL